MPIRLQLESIATQNMELIQRQLDFTFISIICVIIKTDSSLSSPCQMFYYNPPNLSNSAKRNNAM